MVFILFPIILRTFAAKKNNSVTDMANNNKRILVVDDEQDLCEILRFNLETEGYDVDTADSAEMALTLDIKSYDLLLLDVMMGEMSGFALAKELKKMMRQKTFP